MYLLILITLTTFFDAVIMHILHFIVQSISQQNFNLADICLPAGFFHNVSEHHIDGFVLTASDIGHRLGIGIDGFLT